MPKVHVRATTKLGAPFYAKQFDLPWNKFTDLQNALASGLNAVGKHFLDMKGKHKLDLSSLPAEAVVVTLDSGDPDTFNNAGFKVPIDPKLGGARSVAAILDKHLKGF